MNADVETLIARYLAGDPKAIGSVDRWIKGAASEFRKRLAGQWDDVVQTARLQVTKSLRRGAFRGDASLSTYVARVVSHLCIDRLRAQTRTPPALGLEDIADDVADTNHSPLDLVLHREAELILLQVLGSMPAECRRIVAAHRLGAELRRDEPRVGGIGRRAAGQGAALPEEGPGTSRRTVRPAGRRVVTIRGKDRLV